MKPITTHCIFLMCFIFLFSVSKAQNNALDFDGSNDIVETNIVSHGSNFTYEAWVKLNDPSPDWSGIIANKNPDLIGSGVSLALSATGGIEGRNH